jgi:peptidyl-tRNA hydrolase, PTH2 family
MYKQALVVRKNLNMSWGKIISQCAHASLSAYKKAQRQDPEVARAWEMEGQKKVVLKVQSEGELLDYFQKAKAAGIPCEIIRDAGHTQVDPGTLTCFAAGPWNEGELDAIFGKLKLL